MNYWELNAGTQSVGIGCRLPVPDTRPFRNKKRAKSEGHAKSWKLKKLIVVFEMTKSLRGTPMECSDAMYLYRCCRQVRVVYFIFFEVMNRTISLWKRSHTPCNPCPCPIDRGVVPLRHLRHMPPDSVATLVNSLQNRVNRITLCITVNENTGKIVLVTFSVHLDWMAVL